MHIDTINTFLEVIKRPEDQSLMKRLFDGVDFITCDHLKEALTGCCKTLNERLKGCDYSIGFTPNVQVHLITSERKIKTLYEVFNGDEIVALSNASSHTTHHNEKFVDGNNVKCLSVKEWKVADDQSLPKCIKTKTHIEFMTNYPLPYKKV